MSIFVQISIIILIALGVAFIARLFKQPLVISYIIAGVIVGPYFFNIMQASEVLDVFSNIGIALLLFIVGLNLNPKVIKEVGKISLITGVGQVIFTSGIGFLICRVMGFSVITSIYIAIALTFSSTIIIMKLLSDKGDTETLYGKIAIGFLIVQDLIAVLILMIISSTLAENNMSVMGIFIRGFFSLLILFAAGVYALPYVTKIIAKSQEFLLLFSIGWCLALASFFHFLGFSIEIGAILAGITLSVSPYRYEISSKMKPLRDFFIILFFILLGSQMTFSDLSNFVIPIIILSLFILIGNPLIVMTLMGLMGYTKRSGFLAGLTVAQISEFSLILIALGIRVGYITQDILSFVTAVGLITITGSTYMIIYSDKIYPKISKFLRIFERKGKKKGGIAHEDEYEVILFGYNRIGFNLLNSLKKTEHSSLIIDFNPETITQLKKMGARCLYGDAEDTDLLEELKLGKIKMAISTIPELETNLVLTEKIREVNEDAVIIAVSHNIEDAFRLYEAGATYVLMPHFLGGERAADMIEKLGVDISKYEGQKIEHLKQLKERLEQGHEHPNISKDRV